MITRILAASLLGAMLALPLWGLLLLFGAAVAYWHVLLTISALIFIVDAVTPDEQLEPEISKDDLAFIISLVENGGSGAYTTESGETVDIEKIYESIERNNVGAQYVSTRFND